MATQPNSHWNPTPARILAVAALVLFVLAAFSFAGYMTTNGHFLLACGLACIAAQGVL